MKVNAEFRVTAPEHWDLSTEVLRAQAAERLRASVPGIPIFAQAEEVGLMFLRFEGREAVFLVEARGVPKQALAVMGLTGLKEGDRVRLEGALRRKVDVH